MRDARAGTAGAKPKPIAHRQFHKEALAKADQIEKHVRRFADNPRAHARALRNLGVPAQKIREIHKEKVQTLLPSYAVGAQQREQKHRQALEAKAQRAIALGKVPGQDLFDRFVSDLQTAAIYSPAGIYQAGKAVGGDVASTVKGKPTLKRSGRLGKEVAKGVGEDIRHPLRHPGFTAMDIAGGASLVAGTGERLARAGAAVARGESKAAAKALVTKSAPGRIKYKTGDLEVETPASKNVLVRGGQRAQARYLNKHPESPTLKRKVAAALERQTHIESEAARAPANLLTHQGRKLNHAEQKALRVVAEGKPIEDRIRFHREQGAKATSAVERHDHAKEIRLLGAARKYVQDVDGKPRIIPGSKLERVYKNMHAVGGQREKILAETGQMDEAGLEARKHAPGQVIEGTHGASVRAAFEKRIRQDPESLISEYERRFGNVVSTDHARELSPDYAASIESRSRHAADVHEPSTAFARRVYARKLSRRPTEDRTVHFTAGGTGAGKTTALGKDLRGYEIVYDTNLRDYRSSRLKIEQALRSGRKVQIHYVYRDPAEALREGVLPRAEKEGRTVPLDTHIETHVKSNATLRRLMRQFDNDPRVSFDIRINRSHQAPERIGVEDLPKLRYSEVADEVNRAYNEERAAGRVSPRVHEGTFLRRHDGRESHGAREGQEEGLGFRGGEVYVPAFKSEPKGGLGGVAAGSGGSIGRVRNVVSRNKHYTGESLRRGQIPDNTTGLVARQTLRAVRFLQSDRLRAQVLKAATDERRSEHDVLINDRTLKNPTLPPEAKALVGKERYTLDELSGHTTAFEDFRRKLFPMQHRNDYSALTPEERLAAQAGGKVKGYKWVDERLLRGVNKSVRRVQSKTGRAAVGLVDSINNASKMAILYLKPAYALPNVAGNAFLNLVQQGWAAPGNLKRSAYLSNKIGDRAAATLDSVMGEGVAQSIGSEAGVGQRVVNAAAGKWSAVVDLPFRRAAFIHEARKLGYDTPEKLRALLTDEKHRADLLEATQRANEAIIDYSRLGEFEKNIVRRVIFFYPWVKGSTRYAGHYLTEHPTQAAMNAQLAEIGKEKSGLGPVPSYLEGSFKVGGKLVNPAAAGIFGTSSQVVGALRGVFEGHPKEAARLSEFLTPAAGLALANITRQNGLGIPFKAEDNFKDIAKDTLIDSLPQAALLRRIQALRSGEDQSKKLFPVKDKLDVAGPFAIGGVAPRSYNPNTLHSEAQRETRSSLTDDQSTAFDFHEFEQHATKILRAHGIKSLPPEYKARLNLWHERIASRRRAGNTWEEHVASDLEVIYKHGWIDRNQYLEARKNIGRVPKNKRSAVSRQLTDTYFDRDGMLHDGAKSIGLTLPR